MINFPRSGILIGSSCFFSFFLSVSNNSCTPISKFYEASELYLMFVSLLSRCITGAVMTLVTVTVMVMIMFSLS